MIYTIHMNRSVAAGTEIDGDAGGVFDQLVAIPEGLAKSALIFPPFWLAYYRMWWELSVYLLITVFFMALLATSLGPLSLALAGFPGLYLLLEGNQLRRQKLERQGYEFIDVVEASGSKSAVTRFLANWTPAKIRKQESQVPALPRTRRQTDQPSFGMFPQEEN